MSTPSADPSAVGPRIEQLLAATAAAGPGARERAEELVRLVVELYGAGLERLLEMAHDEGALTEQLLDRMADDELVSGLLLVHGLHPHGVADRIERALEDVRPYLGSHGGDVQLLEVTGEGVVRLALLGSCDGCASSAVTLELAVEDAIRAAAPEVLDIVVEEASKGDAVISVASLSVRLRPAHPVGGVTWATGARLEDLAVGGLHGISVEGVDLVLCRLLSGVYAYRDRCSTCGASLSGGGLQRSPVTPGSAVLTCRSCGAHFDIRRAGLDLDDTTRHLEPVPVLERDGIVEVAVRAPVPA